MSFTHPVIKSNVPEYLIGVIAPMFTPVDERGEIDCRGWREYARWLVNDPCVTALFCRSGVGRMFTYTMDDARRSFETVLDEAAGKKPVFCGTSGEFIGDLSQKADPEHYLDQTIELTLYAQENSATAAVLITPAWLPVPGGSTFEETAFTFYKTVHDNTDIPILIYNPQLIPPECATTPSMIRRLNSLDRVYGMKLSTNDMHWLGSLIAANENDRFFMIAGSECVYHQALITGAVGVIGQGCSVYANILRRILDAQMEGDFESARQAQFDVNQALEGFQGLPPDISGFAYLRKKGLNVSPYCRDGSPPLSDDIVEAIYQAIEPYCQKYS